MSNPYIRRVLNTWGHMGLSRRAAPEAYRRLTQAETEEEATQVVIDWLEETRRTEEYRGAREAEGPVEMPHRMQEELARLKQEANESGDSRLVEWLLASEPLLT